MKDGFSIKKLYRGEEAMWIMTIPIRLFDNAKFMALSYEITEKIKELQNIVENAWVVE